MSLRRGWRITDLAGCVGVTGAVVVVDVLRAATSAAVAFSRGCPEILPVTTVAEALAARDARSGSKLMGEVDGLPIVGFDYPNSPSHLERVRLDGVPLVHRTTAGTLGLVRAGGASPVLACAFVNARATVAELRRRAVDDAVTFVATGGGEDRGDEDRACAEYLAAMLGGDDPDPQPWLARVRVSAAAAKFLDPAAQDFPARDVTLACDANRFGFAMVAQPSAWGTVLRALPAQGGRSPET